MWEGAGGKTLDISGKNNHGTLTNGPLWAGGLKFDGVNDHVLRNITAFRSSDQSGSVSVRFKTTATAAMTLFGSASTSDTGFNQNIKFLANGGVAGALYIGTELNGSDSAVRTTATTFNDGNFHTVVFSSNGSSWSIIVDGVLRALTVVGGANNGHWFADVPNRDNITVGGLVQRTSSGDWFSGTVSNLRVWNRTLSIPEAQQLHLNSDAGLWVPDVTRYYIPAAGAYVLLADPGAFGITGASAGVLSGRMLSGGPASYAITGAAAATVAGRAISASPGAFDVTGTAAGAIADRIIDASPGTITITGVAAGILADRLLSAAPGVIAITGVAAALIGTTAGAYTLNVDPGAFGITGAAAGILADRIITASPGVMNITGMDAGAIAGRLLSAIPGTYSVTGASAGAIVARLLNADPGAYVITGLSATFDAPASISYGINIVVLSEPRNIVVLAEPRNFVVN